MVAVVVVAGVIFYFINGGSGGDDQGSITRPSNAIEMKVGAVRSDGTFTGQVEPAGRNAQNGLKKFGTDDRVTLRLLDIEPPLTFGDTCWRDEGKEAIEDLVGARIWVDANHVRERGSGTFTVYAWNRAGTFVQEQLVRDGNGKIIGDGVSYPRYRDSLTAAEDEADAADRGLWGACGVS